MSLFPDKDDYGFVVAIDKLKWAFEQADAIVIGAGAGLSTAAGFEYGGERFQENFPGYTKRYGFSDEYSGGFYPYRTMEEFWAFWARAIMLNRYTEPSKLYVDLLNKVSDRNYFVLTTNVDHQFQLAGFDKERLFYTQGDYGLFQCSRPCHLETWDNEEEIRAMYEAIDGFKIPTEMIPKCPVCGADANMNLRCDDTFVEDLGWHDACARYEKFINENKDKRILYLELGVGMNTPGIIKYPFWRFTKMNKKATYACVNLLQVYCPREIENQSICIKADIARVIKSL